MEARRSNLRTQVEALNDQYAAYVPFLAYKSNKQIEDPYVSTGRLRYNEW